MSACVAVLLGVGAVSNASVYKVYSRAPLPLKLVNDLFARDLETTFDGFQWNVPITGGKLVAQMTADPLNQANEAQITFLQQAFNNGDTGSWAGNFAQESRVAFIDRESGPVRSE